VEINATILVQIFLVVALLLWLSPALFAPIMRLFEERERRIVGAQEASAQMSKEALAKAQAFDKQYEQARHNARQVLTELKTKADHEQAQTLGAVRSQAKEQIKAAEQELIREETRVRAELVVVEDDIAKEIVKTLTAKPLPKMESQSEALRM
jgi:F-type H+-transporting ATPase subunit b